MTKASILRELLNRQETLVAPGCHDPLSARLVEDLGFGAVYLGGFATGAQSTITEPLLGMTEQLEAGRAINNGIGIPLMMDAGAGWGDALHTVRTVRAFEEVGIAGFHIEDQVVPKRASYFRNVMRVVPREVFIEKIRFAVEARRDPDTVIIGRTDAFSAHDGTAEEALARGNALMDAGVDMVFFRGVSEIADMERFRKEAADIPQFTMSQGDIPLDVYRDLGYRVVIYPIMSIFSAYHSMRDAYVRLRDVSAEPLWEREPYWEARREIFELLRQEEMWDIERRTVEPTEPHRPFIPTEE